MTVHLQESRRLRALAMIVIFTAALALRLCFVFATVRHLPPDTDGYQILAANLLSGRGFAGADGMPTAYRPPGYPLFLAAGRLISGSWWGPIYLQCVFAAAVVFFAAEIARAIVGEVFAPLAALIVAIDPFEIAVCGQFMTEAFFTFLVAGSLFALLWAIRTRSAGRYVVAGLVIAAGVVTRPEFLVFVPGALLAAVFWGRKRRKFICTGLLMLSVAAPPALWAARNRHAVGAPVFTTTHGGYTHLLLYNDVFYGEVIRGSMDKWGPTSLADWQEGLVAETKGMRETERDAYQYAKAREFIISNPSAAAHTALVAAGRFWRPFPHEASPVRRIATGAFFILLAALACGGMLVTWRRRPLTWLIVYVLVAETLVHVYYWSNLRMRIPFHPLLAVLAAAGAAALFGRTPLPEEALTVPERDPLYSPAV